MSKETLAALGKKLRTYALAYPETNEEFPRGESAFQMKGRTFVS